MLITLILQTRADLPTARPLLEVEGEDEERAASVLLRAAELRGKLPCSVCLLLFIAVLLSCCLISFLCGKLAYLREEPKGGVLKGGSSWFGTLPYKCTGEGLDALLLSD